MGAKTFKCYSSLILLLYFLFQTSPEFTSHWPSQKCFCIFEILTVLFFFVNMGPYGSKNFKTTSYLKMFLEFSSQWSSQVLFRIFLNSFLTRSFTNLGICPSSTRVRPRRNNISEHTGRIPKFPHATYC